MLIFQRLLLAFVLFTGLSVAWADGPQAAPASTVSTLTPATIKRELLQTLRAEGTITQEQQDAAVQKHITAADDVRFDKYVENTSWTRHITWKLMLSCLGLLFIFVAMWGWLKKSIPFFKRWIKGVPVIVYQSTFLAVSLAGLLVPHRIFPSHAFDLALFCAFSTPLLVVWTIATNGWLAGFVLIFLRREAVARYLVPLVGAVYFLIVAVAYKSQILGLAAAWFLLSLPYLAAEDVGRKAGVRGDTRHLMSAHISHLFGAALWLVLVPMFGGNAVTSVLSVAATYYLPAAICLMLALAMAPLYTHNNAGHRVFYVGLYIVLVAASFSNAFAAMPAMNSLLTVTGIATVLFWIIERSFRIGYLIGTFVTGAALYVLSLNIDAIRAWLSTVHFVA